MAEFTVDFFSQSLNVTTTLNVFIPQILGKPIDEVKKEKFKTLYLLHGLTDSQTAWKSLTNVIRYARERKMAVVMPSAHNSWYSNMKYGFNYLDFVGEELPKVCQMFFSQLSDKKEDNIIAGNSMGGYGALKIALTFPQNFGYVGCFSGAFDAYEIVDYCYKDRSGYVKALFGDKDEYLKSQNNIFNLVKEYHLSGKEKPSIYMWCGEQDEVVGLFKANVEMKKLLEECGYDFVYNQTQGVHDWKYWDKYCEEMLKWYDQKRQTKD